jgi:hypothetical protein
MLVRMTVAMDGSRPMPARNLYVRDQDEPVWQQAERLAKIAKLSMSQLATIGLRRLMPSAPDILVHVTDAEHPGEVADVVDGRHMLIYFSRDPEHRKAGWRLTESHETPHDDFTTGEPWDPPLEWARQRIENWQRERLARTSMTDITVEVGDQEGNRWDEVFTGRWLIEPAYGDRSGTAAGAGYGIAQTERGKIAVYRHHGDDGVPPSLEVFASLDDVELDEDTLAIAVAAMGERRVVRRDI